MVSKKTILSMVGIVTPVALGTLVISLLVVRPVVESSAVTTSDIADDAVSLAKLGVSAKTYTETVSLGTIPAAPDTRTSYPVLVIPANKNISQGKIRSITYTLANNAHATDGSHFYVQKPGTDLALCDSVMNNPFINVTAGLNPIYSHWCNIGAQSGTSFTPATSTTPIVYRLVYDQGSAGVELKNFTVTIEYSLNN